MSEVSAKKAVKHAKKASKQAEKKIDNTAQDVNAKAEEAVDSAAESTQEAADAAKESAYHLAETLGAKAEHLVAEAKAELEKITEIAKESNERYSSKALDGLKDPAVSTTVLFTAVTSSAAFTYLSQQHKQGKLNAIVAVGVAVGVTALSVAEYFSVKAYFKRNNGSA